RVRARQARGTRRRGGRAPRREPGPARHATDDRARAGRHAGRARLLSRAVPDDARTRGPPGRAPSGRFVGALRAHRGGRLTVVPVDVLAVGAHPDDAELGCGATLATFAAKGRSFGILDLTRGEMGTRGTPEIREEEAREAARILGATFRETLDLGDGGLRTDR